MPNKFCLIIIIGVTGYPYLSLYDFLDWNTALHMIQPNYNVTLHPFVNTTLNNEYCKPTQYNHKYVYICYRNVGDISMVLASTKLISNTGCLNN